jgi:hypothetical protein
LIGKLRDPIFEGGCSDTSSICRQILELNNREEINSKVTAKKNKLADLNEFEEFKEERTNRVIFIKE